MKDNETTVATILHIKAVREIFSDFVFEVRGRSLYHDQSKLKEPEVSMFAEWSPKLSAMEYGSPEYKEALKEMGPALQHHYEHNRHHPEHFFDGINDMNLFDMLEMLADWKASAERVKDGDIFKSLEINAERFDMPPAITRMLLNTAYYLDWNKK